LSKIPAKIISMLRIGITSIVEKVRPIEITVCERVSGEEKTAVLEARPSHTLGAVIRTVIEGLGLPTARYKFMVSEGPRFRMLCNYDLTLEEAGIHTGQTLELTS